MRLEIWVTTVYFSAWKDCKKESTLIDPNLKTTHLYCRTTHKHAWWYIEMQSTYFTTWGIFFSRA